MNGISLGSIGEENNFENMNRRIDANEILSNDNESDQREGVN
jgi:hypothetical protein